MDRRANDWQENEFVQLGQTTVVVKRGHLFQLVFEAGQLSEWPKGAFGPNRVPSAVLKSVLIYSLALNTCATEEIVQAANSPALRYLAANHSLDWETVHEFRRRNISLVIAALARLFEELGGFASISNVTGMSRSAAEARVRRAVQADSILLDL